MEYSRNSELRHCGISDLHLCCAAVNEHLNTGNEAGIIGCQKESSGCDLTRLTHSSHRNYGNETVYHFLRSPVKYRRIYRAWTNHIDPDPSFELGSPSSGERTDSRFAGAVDGSAWKSLHSGNGTIQND